MFQRSTTSAQWLDFFLVYLSLSGGLTHFPASDTEEETEDIGLLALLQLLDVLEGTLYRDKCVSATFSLHSHGVDLYMLEYPIGRYLQELQANVPF